VTAAQIRDARTRLGESPAEFATRFGVKRPTVYKWEAGQPVAEAYRLQLAHVIAQAKRHKKPKRPGQDVAKQMTKDLLAAMARHEPILIPDPAGGIVYGPEGREAK